MLKCVHKYKIPICYNIITYVNDEYVWISRELTNRRLRKS